MKKLRFAAALFLAPLALNGCGSGGDSTSGTTDPSVRPLPAAALTVETGGGEMSFCENGSTKPRIDTFNRDINLRANGGDVTVTEAKLGMADNVTLLGVSAIPEGEWSWFGGVDHWPVVQADLPRSDNITSLMPLENMVIREGEAATPVVGLEATPPAMMHTMAITYADQYGDEHSLEVPMHVEYNNSDCDK